MEDGYLKLPTGPELGIEVDEEALKDKLGHEWINKQTFDSRDESVVDW